VTRVLVTGGAGFIGSHFVKRSLAAHPDWHIVNLDKLSYAGNLDNLADLPAPARHEFVRGDICDRELVARLWGKGFDLVVNFAAETHVDRSLLWADEFIRTDVLGAFTLLETARERGVGRFLYISTDEVYGEVTTGSVAEDAALRPRNPYAATKAAADQLAYAYWNTHRVPVIVTRCANNFGPNQHPEKFMPLFITNALLDQPLPLYGDGRQVRDWIHVEDHCAALDLLLARGVTGEVYNIAAGNEVANCEVAQQICRQLGKPASLIRHVADRPGHDRRYAINTDKLRALGWRPQREFASALAATVDWYREHRDWWQRARSDEFRQYYAAQYGSRL